MSESSRKRSRKSKIVLRECLEIDDENGTYLQKNNAMFPNLSKIILKPFSNKTKTVTRSETTTKEDNTHFFHDYRTMIGNEKKPHLEFSVTVAIEKFDEDSTDLVIDETNDDNVSTNIDDNESSKIDDNVSSKIDDNVSSKIDDNVSSKNDDNVSSKNDDNVSSKPDNNVSSTVDNVSSKIDYINQVTVKQEIDDNYEIIVKQEIDDNEVETFTADFDDSNKDFDVNEVTITTDVDDNNQDFGENEIIIKSEPRECVLERNDIIEAVNKIMDDTPDIADRLLSIAVKNCLGHFTKCYLDPFATKIHKVLIQWMDWQKVDSKIKSSPLFYKCYICEQAWWYLADFREHLRKHPFFKLDLEEYTAFESSIIAYIGGFFEIKHFDPIGECPKCGYESSNHWKKNRQKDLLYNCKVSNCSLLFPTCSALKNHEYTSHTISELTGTVFKGGKWKKSCEVCGIPFYTHATYKSHMDLMHSVRSDLVVPVVYKKCHSCKRRYLNNYMQHTCIMKGISNKCNNCFRTYPKGYLFLTHVNRLETYTCGICKKVLPNRCMEAEHMMSHSDKFALVKKCILCKEFRVFDKGDIALHHGRILHGSDMCYYDSIILPKCCLPWTTLTNSDMDKQDFTDGDQCTAIEPARIEIKQEIIDDYPQNEEENTIQIKQELDYDMQDYSIKLEEQETNIFDDTLNETNSNVVVKEEMQDEESEYEDDIIRLDINEMHSLDIKDESMQDDMQDEKNPPRVPKLYSCHKCGFEAVHKAYREHLKTDCVEEEMSCFYTCMKCFTTFDRFKSYLSHFSTKHGLKKLTCPLCFKTFDQMPILASHVFLHIRMRYITKQEIIGGNITMLLHKCKICNEIILKKDFFEHWEKHLALVEPEKEKSDDNCEQSDTPKALDKEKVKKIINLLQSPEYCTKNKPGCIVCHRHFHRRNDCKRHLIEHLLSDAYTMRPEYKALKCQICVSSFKKADDYKQHMRDHARLPVYKCDLCHKTFSDSSNYAKHKKVHNINAYTCDICGRKFNAKFSIEKHMALHAVLKPIKCTPCDKLFYTSSTYKKHVKLLHEKKTDQFRCMVCSQRFSSLKDKWDHMWEIHKERTSEVDCYLCPERFRRFRDLHQHLKTEHNVVIPYKQKRDMRRRREIQGSDEDTSYERETLIVYV